MKYNKHVWSEVQFISMKWLEGESNWPHCYSTFLMQTGCSVLFSSHCAVSVCGCVDTTPVLSLVYACENPKLVISYPFFKYKSIFLNQCCALTQRLTCASSLQLLLCVHLNNNTLFVKRWYKKLGKQVESLQWRPWAG